MAELLIKSQQTGSGPGAYLRGHVVAIRPDGHQWGAKEGPPLFYVLEAPDAFVQDNPELRLVEMDGDVTLRRRKWRLDIDELPPGILVALQATGRAAVAQGLLTAVLKLEDRVPENLTARRVLAVALISLDRLEEEAERLRGERNG